MKRVQLVCAAVAALSAAAAAPAGGHRAHAAELVYVRAGAATSELVVLDAYGGRGKVVRRHSPPVATFAWRGANVTYTSWLEDGTIFEVSGAGGAPRDLLKLPTRLEIRALDWSPDGQELAFSGSRGLGVVRLQDPKIHWLLRGHGYWALKWSPDGTQIVVQADDKMRVINALGTGGRYLGPGRNPVWSPDGARIAYHDSDADSLAVVNVDGSSPARIATTKSPCVSISWAPRDEIVFDDGCTYSDSGIEAIHADGSDRKTLVSGGGEPAWSPSGNRLLMVTRTNLVVYDPSQGTTRELIRPQPGADGAPHWSRDGTKLAFAGWSGVVTRLADGTFQKWPPTDAAPSSWAPDGHRIVATVADNIEIVDTRNWSTTPVAVDCGAGCPSYCAPSWSPSGQYIVFTTDFGGFGMYDVKKKKAALFPLVGDNPDWSPDSRRIVYDSGRCLGSEAHAAVFVANADGSGKHRIAKNASDPAWSRDGKLIAFVRKVGRNNREIFVMRSDGSKQRRLTHHIGDDVEPDWR